MRRKRSRHLQQQEFNLFDGEDPNEFLKNHDVVEVVDYAIEQRKRGIGG